MRIAALRAMTRSLAVTHLALSLALACGGASNDPAQDSSGSASADDDDAGPGGDDASVSVDDGSGSDPSADDGSGSDPSADGSSDGSDTGVPTGGCFAEGEVPPSVSPSGFAMPTLDDERATYERWGLTWAPEAEPNVPAEPGFMVMDPDIHGDTEADDLWTYVTMHTRTGQAGYLDRATAWRRYFVEDYVACVGGEYASFCYDRDAFGADHLWGWGLLTWHETMRDPEALAAAEEIGGVVEELWAPDSPFGCLPSGGCVYYGLRQIGRHLLLVTRLAEITGDARWSDLRDTMIDKLLTAPEWDAERGMWFQGDYGTDEALGTGAWAAGARVQSPFMVGVVGEGIDHAYRTTGNEELRARMIAMADFVDQHGLDPEYDYTGSMFGIVDGQTWHNYSAQEPVEFWDPVYTTALVNTLVRGWRYTCDPHYYERARHFFERGNRGLYGEPVETAAPEGQIHHFVDSVFDTSQGLFYLSYNKGELQYTYLLFDPDAPS
jgi:hypothetical protein